MDEGVVVTVSAPSGAGKTSLVNGAVQALPNVELSVSHTTREQRRGEQDGRDYHFVTAEQFRRMVAAGEFLEHAEVFGNLYGTAVGEVRARREAGRDVILEIDWQGARQVRSAFADAISVFVLPPSREALEKRLHGRGRESPEQVAARMAGAIAEMRHYDESDYLLVNDDFDTALAELCAIITAQRQRRSYQQARHASLIAALLA